MATPERTESARQKQRLLQIALSRVLIMDRSESSTAILPVRFVVLGILSSPTSTWDTCSSLLRSSALASDHPASLQPRLDFFLRDLNILQFHAFDQYHILSVPGPSLVPISPSPSLASAYHVALSLPAPRPVWLESSCQGRMNRGMRSAGFPMVRADGWY